MVCGKITKKNINMKQLLSLFLFLVPCLAWAQYPSNGNQKITLGEQTTADGLIYRGVLADTGIITPSSDTSAYIILDTANHRFYNYNRATNVWSVAGGGTAVTTFSGGSTGLTPSTATSGAVTLAGTLAVANGGTNASTFTQGSVVFAGASGTYTQDNSGLFYDNTNDRLGIGTTTPNYKLHIKTGSSGRTSHASQMKMVIEESVEAYYAVNTDNGYGGFRVFSTPAGNADAAFEYWAPNRRFHFLSTGYFAFNGKGNTEMFKIDSTGNIGINVVVPTEKLHVVGNARITAMNAINDIGADANGVLQAATSDMNLKNTIENSPFGLNEILLLNPVTFLYNDVNRKLDSNVKEVGFIAQDVFDIIPNAVSSTGIGDLQLDYRAITATLTKAIQEQQALIKALEQRIINLENK
jgi:hypothetical protein